MVFIFYNKHTCQTEISLSAKKKKSSKSGGAKKAIGDLCSEQFETTLCFLGAGGHVKISGILNLWAFGVEQPLDEVSSTPSEFIWSSIFEKSLEPVVVVVVEELDLEGKFLDIASWFLRCTSLFLKFFLLGFLVGLLVVVVLPDGAIWNTMIKLASARIFSWRASNKLKPLPNLQGRLLVKHKTYTRKPYWNTIKLLISLKSSGKREKKCSNL